MNHPRSLAVTVAVAALVIAGCGSTRFVVVESPESERPAAAAGATPTETTTPAAEASERERAAIEDAIDTALTTNDRSFRERLPALDGADDLEPTFAAVTDLVAELDVELVIGEVTVSGEEATAMMSVVVDGADFATDLPVTLVRSGDEWKVTRAGACTLLALASPCPDAPAAG